MTLKTKTMSRPVAKAKAADAAAFIGGAPDTKPGRWVRGAKTQFTFSIAPELLARIDAEATRRYLSRAALLTTWAVEGLERDAPKGAE